MHQTAAPRVESDEPWVPALILGVLADLASLKKQIDARDEHNPNA